MDLEFTKSKGNEISKRNSVSKKCFVLLIVFLVSIISYDGSVSAKPFVIIYPYRNIRKLKQKIITKFIARFKI